MKIKIIGAGVGDEKFLTQYGKMAILQSDFVITTDRLFGKLKHLNKNTVSAEIMSFQSLIKENSHLGTIAVLASGDVGFYSIAKSLKNAFADTDVELISGISSLQYWFNESSVSEDCIRALDVCLDLYPC